MKFKKKKKKINKIKSKNYFLIKIVLNLGFLGKNVIARSKNGTGKTGAFAIPIL